MNDAKITIILRKEAGITKKLRTNNYFSHLLGVFCKTDYLCTRIIIFYTIMKRSIIHVLTLFTLFASFSAFPSLQAQASPGSDHREQLPAIEMLADRTIIYPGRLDLQGDETLMGILQMYPELLIGGYDNLLGSYQLRLDNVAISGDSRLLMSQIKASIIQKIQICDNSGVAKGRTGEGCVIDINLRETEDNAHGYTALQYATNHQLSGTANIRYGDEHTDVFVNAQFNRTDIKSIYKDQQYLHAEMTNRLTDRDVIRSYVNQSYKNTNTPSENLRKNLREEMFLIRTRWFHTFNQLGTELLTMLTYTRENNPLEQFAIRDNEHRIIRNSYDLPAWLLELNTPIPYIKGLKMMSGIEAGYNIQDYGINQLNETGLAFDEESTYHIFHHDVYLQFNYRRGPLLFTIGDRAMFYHYNQKGYSGGWSKNSTRNMFQVSTVFTPHPRHQFQLAYFRKFTNPSALDVFIELWPNTAGTFIGGKADLEETRVNQFKLAYGYTQHNFTVKANGSYYTTSNEDRYYKAGTSIYYKVGNLSLTAGYNIYSIKNTAIPDADRTTYHDARLASKLSLPRQWLLGARWIWYSKDMPYRVSNYDDKPFYGGFEVIKRFHSNRSIGLHWHDIFHSDLSAVIATAQWNF